MDPEFSRLINLAADIAPSGKWEAVNTRIEELAANPGPGNAWYVQALAGLCSHAFSEYLWLKKAYERNDPADDASLLAWRARNLLELCVWSIYCTRSIENARRFYEDAGRDVLGVFNAFTKWGSKTGQDTDWIDPLEAAKQGLKSRAGAEGIASLEGSYTWVSNAAKECGFGDMISVDYKLLSKFAHPTAMRILGAPDDAKNALQRDVFFSKGCLFFTGAFEALERQLIESAVGPTSPK